MFKKGNSVQVQRLLHRLMTTALVLLLAACATGSVTDEERSRVSEGNTILVFSKLNDQVFGTRSEGIWQKMTPVYQTSWDSNAEITKAAEQSIAASGRKVHSVQSHEVTLETRTDDASLDEAFIAISKSIAKQHSEFNADVNVIVLPTPLDRYGRTASAGRSALSILTWGPLGLVSASQEDFRPTFAVHVSDWGGEVHCVVAYSLVAVEGRTHELLAKLQNRIIWSPLPDNFWIGDYRSLTNEQKSVLEKSCVEGVTNSITQDLHDLRIGSTSPAS